MHVMLIGHILIIIAMLSFTTAAALFVYSYGLPGLKRKRPLKTALWTLGIAFVALIFTHAGILIHGVHSISPSFILIEIVCLLTLWSYRFLNIPFIGMFVSPLCTLLLLYEVFASAHPSTASAAPFGLARVHITLAILGQAFAVISAALSALYLQQHRALKKKDLQLAQDNTIPLDSLGRLLYQSLWLGFILISLALLSGAIYVQFFAPTSYSGIELKFIWAVLVWIYYLSLLICRSLFNWTAKRVAQSALGIFILLAISFFGFLTPSYGGH